MSLYLPSITLAGAFEFQSMLWDVQRPPIVRLPEDATAYNGPVFHHASLPPVSYVGQDPIYISPYAQPTIFDPILAPYVALALVTEAEVQLVRDAIQQNIGSRLSIPSFLPDFFADKLITEDQMLALGYVLADGPDSLPPNP